MKWFPLAAVIASVALAGCGSSGPVTEAHALSNLIAEINAGPSWESSADAAAAAANLGHLAGANEHCTQAKGRPGFVCYLEYSNPTGPSASQGTAELYFAENADGGAVRPITAAAYAQAAGTPAPTPTPTTTTQPPPTPTPTPTPHVAGKECEGAAVIAGPDTSCPFARAVAIAALHGPHPSGGTGITNSDTGTSYTGATHTESVDAYSPITHKRYRMICRSVQATGLTRCTGGIGAVVTLGSSTPPTTSGSGTTPSGACTQTTVRSAAGERACHGKVRTQPIVWHCDAGDIDKAGVCVSATTGQPSPDRWYPDPKQGPCTAPSTYETIDAQTQRPVCMSLLQFARWKAAGEP